jgi:acyl carrier protein
VIDNGFVANVSQSQVVGIDDPFIGQAIAGILRSEDTTEDVAALKQRAQSSVVAELGPAFRLTATYTLSELGLDSFPMTATNKVRKVELQNKVREQMQGNWNGSSFGNRSTLESVTDIWQRVLATGPAEIAPDTSITHIADSLALMQFCSLVQRRLNKRLTPTDILENETPRLQVALLDERSGTNQQETNSSQPLAAKSSASQSWLTTSIRSKLVSRLTEMGFNWEADVEAVYQGIDAIEMFDAPKCRPASHNFRWTWRSKRDLSPDHISVCLMKCLQSHASLRAVVIPLEDNTWFPSAPHVVLRSSEQWLDTLVQVVQPVENVESLRLTARSAALPFAEAGGPCFRAQVVPVSGSERPGLVMTINHAVFDAVSISAFLDDLEELLAGDRVELRSLIQYNVFADMYDLHKGGLAGQISKSYQLDKLQHLDGIEPCLWPPTRGCGYMIGNDAGWRHPDGSPGRTMERVGRDGVVGTERGEPVTGTFDVSGLRWLKSSRGIEPFVLIKAALAIFNVSQTKQPRAVFSSPEAGRNWPFMEPWIASQLPSPMDVAGPTLGWAFDFIDVQPSMTVGELLQQVAEAQKLNTEHCHAPWKTIIRELGPQRGDLIHDMAARQVVSWDPSTSRRAQTQQRLLEQLDRQAFLDYGLFWNFGLEGSTRITAFAIYDDVHLERSEVDAALQSVQRLIEKLSESGNWNQLVNKLISL